LKSPNPLSQRRPPRIRPPARSPRRRRSGWPKPLQQPPLSRVGYQLGDFLASPPGPIVRLWLNDETRPSVTVSNKVGHVCAHGGPDSVSGNRPSPTCCADVSAPSGGDRPVQLAPGMLVSIYGTGLGPREGCIGQADTKSREAPSPLRPDQAFVE